MRKIGFQSHANIPLQNHPFNQVNLDIVLKQRVKKFPFLGGGWRLGHQIPRGHRTEVHSRLKRRILKIKIPWPHHEISGSTRGDLLSKGINHNEQVLILIYLRLIPGAHHKQPDQAGRQVEEPVQYP
jgi:hypothetical protein